MTDTIVVSLGIFIVTAFSVVIILLQKKNLHVGYWPLIGAVGAFITIGELFAIMGNEPLHRVMILITMFIFSAVALMKFWETLSIDY